MPPVPSAPEPTDTSAFLFSKVSGHSPVCIEQKVIGTCSISPWAVKQCVIFLIPPQDDKIELNCIVMYFSAKEWPEQFLQFPPHTFQRAGQFIFAILPPSIACIYRFFFFFSTIALGELIVILNMAFLPACPQGKEKPRMKHGITIKPDTCTEHDLLWALRCCDFPSQREKGKWKGKCKQCGTRLITTQQKNVFLQISLKRTTLLLSKDRAN